MSTMPLFDAPSSREAREEGIERASSPLARSRFLAEAQGVARWLAEGGNEITADDLVAYYIGLGINISLELGNAMGALFRGPRWEWTGRVVNSQRVGRHASAIRVWRLV